MSGTKTTQSTRTLFYSFAVISLAAFGLWIGVNNNTAEASTTVASTNWAPAASFAADVASLGAIPDAPAVGCGQTTGLTPKNVTFTVSGISGSVSSVDVSNLTFGPVHTWGSDVTAVLIAPNGASHTLFGRTGATTATSCNDSSPLQGPYGFSDAAATPPSGGWWQASTAATGTIPIATGTYRTTATGGAGATNPMPPTTMNPSFTGVANANGTWTLRLTDGGGGDTGAVSAATLNVTGGVVAVPQDANTDFNGDGKTDFVVARATTTPLSEATAPSLAPISKMVRDQEKGWRNRSSKNLSDNVLAPPIYWYSSINGSGVTGVGQFGDANTDFVVTEDFDGDTKDDLTVWTEGAANSANFKILQSSNNTVRVEFFGQVGDDPTVVGDYDGDGKADPAVYRCPESVAGQCYFYYRGSLSNPSGNVTFVPWGFGTQSDFYPYTGDFDGDGKNDFCIQRANPAQPGQGQFVLLKSNGLGIEYIGWGLSTDLIVPGDYDGDGKTDFTVLRGTATKTFYTLTRTGATSQVQWGISGDLAVPGDYDGDGKTDIAIWRPSTDPNQNYFWVINSNNASISQFEWGQCPTGNCDYPVANWAVH